MLQIRVSDRLVCGLFMLHIELYKCCKSAYQTGWCMDYSFVMLYIELYKCCKSAYHTGWYADYSCCISNCINVAHPHIRQVGMRTIHLSCCIPNCIHVAHPHIRQVDMRTIHLSCCKSNCIHVAHPHTRQVGMRTIHIAYRTVQIMLQVHLSDRLVYRLFILYIELCKCCKSAYQTGWYADYSFVPLHITLN
jgi:hypothetical protein